MLLSPVNWWYSPSFLNQPPVFVDAAFSPFQTSPNETWNCRQLLQAIGTGDLTCKSSALSCGRNRKQEVQKICWGKNRSLRFCFEHSHAWYVLQGTQGADLLCSCSTSSKTKSKKIKSILLHFRGLRCHSFAQSLRECAAPRFWLLGTRQFPWARTIAW